ncbi:MAG: hypothetical protein V4722_06385 [Bacteroidota bacterium]
MQTIKKLSSLLLMLTIASLSYGQQKQHFDLFKMSTEGQLVVVHRTMKPIKDGRYQGVQLSMDSSEGLAWIKNASFKAGTIEFDVRGKELFQKSFVGVAFHGQNDSTFDAIYFRPFNFFSTDSVRKIHAVQYISHPLFTWKKLRDNPATNSKYEKVVANPPDPNGWFHVKVVIMAGFVKVYINDRADPELIVKQLSTFGTGKIGLFTGDGAGGDFANLVVEQ